MDSLRDSYQYGSSPLALDAANQPLEVYFFGLPITKALSSVLVPVLFKSLSLQWKFIPVNTKNPSEFNQRRDLTNFIGSSITMPNKIAYMPLIDDLTEEARAIGAVNTTFLRIDSGGKRRHVGTNTDCIGIRDTLIQKVEGIAGLATNRPAMVIGAGGAARSALYSLWRWMKPSEIYISNRLQSEVDEMAASLKVNIPGMKLRYVGDVTAAEKLPTPYIIIGTIPDFPAQEAGEIEGVKIYRHFLARKDKGVLLDMCYVPHFLTRLFVAGRDHGWTVISGMDVLVRVIVAQVVFWFESQPSENGVKQILDIVYVRASKGTAQPSNL